MVHQRHNYVCIFLGVIGCAVGVIGCDSGTVESAKDKLNDSAKQLSDQGKKVGRQLMLKGKRWATWSLDEAAEFGQSVLEEYGDDLNSAGSVINDVLNSIAKDPDVDLTTTERVGRIVVLMIPLVGPTKRFADARKQFESGEIEQDKLKMQKARRECVVAMAEAGLDIGTLGLVGAKVDLIATGADKVLVLLKLSRNVDELTDSDLKTFDHYIDMLLADDDVRNGIDMALKADFSELVVN